ncbi:hypothetical protein PHMEG_00026446, partial [Phytophthora megakarya]
GSSLLNPSNFLAFMRDIGVDDSVQNLDEDSLGQLQDVLSSSATCGMKLQAIISKVTQFVADFKSANPVTAVSSIRQALSVSELFLSDIPDVTNNCVRNLTDDAFTTRDSLRTIMSTITDGLVDGSVDDDGQSKSTSEYLASVADMGLDVIAMFDPTGIAEMMAEFIQPLCGPTAFMGEIDDGSLADALALTTEGYAFNGSSGSWSKTGDGIVKITFESFDSKDVTVHIHSGGDTVAKVDVDSCDTVTWNSTVKELQDKTLYLDRWRAGLLGVPGSGGGSLLMWVPHSSSGGNIELRVQIHEEDENVNQCNGSETDIKQSSASGEGSLDDIVTLVPKDEDQTSQKSGSSSEDDEIVFPAPASSRDDSVTPAPTNKPTIYLPKNTQVSGSEVGKPRSKTVWKKMKAPDDEEYEDHHGSGWSEEDLKSMYHCKELRDFVDQDPVMWTLKLKRIADPKEPVMAPAALTNRFDGAMELIHLSKEAATCRTLFEKLKFLVSEVPQNPDPLPLTTAGVVDNLTVSSHYAIDAGGEIQDPPL